MKQVDLHWQKNRPFNTQFNDIYFSHDDGMAETEYVFLSQNDLPERWRGKPHFTIAETGFGTGLNFLTSVYHWLKTADQNACLYYFSVEKYPLTKADLKRGLSAWPVLEDLLTEFLEHYPPAVGSFHHIPLFNHRVVLTLMFGEVETILNQMKAHVDAWYLDGFAPDKNPEMWTESVFKHIKNLSNLGTTFSSFTAVGRVRRALQKVGFEVEKVKGFAKKREMCRGKLSHKTDQNIDLPWFEIGQSEYQNKHAIIIGAGLAGVSTAWALAKRGWHIDLVEQNGDIAQGGSGNPLGILIPRISLNESVESAFYAAAYIKAICELNDLKKADSTFFWQQSGVLQLAINQRILKQIEQLSCADDFVQALSAKRASEIAGIAINCKALYFPLAGWLNPSDLCSRLIKSAKGRIKLHFNTTVSRLFFQNGLWHCKDKRDQLQLKSEVLVLANAAQALQFQESSWLPIEPARGQVTSIPVTEQSKNIHSAICYEGYILPEDHGKHLIGATFSRGDHDTELRDEDDRENLRHLMQQFPGTFNFNAPEGKKSVVKSRAGIRAVTPDRMPLVGPVADIDYFKTRYHDFYKGKSSAIYPKAQYLNGLYINVGHGAKGLCSSFLSAELLASQINNEGLPVSQAVQNALNPSRFIIRNLKKL